MRRVKRPEPPRLALVGVPREGGLAPVSAAFVVFGMFWGAWAVATVDVERALGLSNAGFGLLLSLSLTGAAAGNFAGGAATERWGTGAVLGGSLTVWSALTVLVSAVHHRVALAALVIALLSLGGLVDVAMNVAATASLAAQPGFLVRFHARFNGGAAVGAGVQGALLAGHHDWRLTWALIGVAGMIVGLVALRWDLPAGQGGESVSLRVVLGLIRSERLGLVAAAFAVGAMVEGGIDLWGVLYMRTRLGSGLLIGTGGAVVAYMVAAAARVSLGPRAAQGGTARGLFLGAGASAVGILALALAPWPALGAAGLVLGAGGISMSWPLLVAHASGGRDRPGPVVGAVTAVGYLGLVTGPSVVGLVAEGLGLRWGLGLLAVAAVFVALVPGLTVRRDGARRQRSGP
jgi:MFS family permease